MLYIFLEGSEWDFFLSKYISTQSLGLTVILPIRNQFAGLLRHQLFITMIDGIHPIYKESSSGLSSSSSMVELCQLKEVSSGWRRGANIAVWNGRTVLDLTQGNIVT